jgi:hypothetical protein
MIFRQLCTARLRRDHLPAIFFDAFVYCHQEQRWAEITKAQCSRCYQYAYEWTTGEPLVRHERPPTDEITSIR